MHKPSLPSYEPAFAAPERAVLTLLSAALRVAVQSLRDEHHQIDRAPALDEHHAPLVVATARLIIDRCAELGSLIDFYDDAVDQVLRHDDEVPF